MTFVWKGRLLISTKTIYYSTSRYCWIEWIQHCRYVQHSRTNFLQLVDSNYEWEKLKPHKTSQSSLFYCILYSCYYPISPIYSSFFTCLINHMKPFFIFLMLDYRNKLNLWTHWAFILITQQLTSIIECFCMHTFF